MDLFSLKKKIVVVLGLGLHGGGISAAKFCSKAGAHVIVTDKKDAKTLRNSIEALKGYPITFVLGEHRKKDIEEADIVLKNPAIPAQSHILTWANWIETDISLFLRTKKDWQQHWGITGSKGKSTTTALLGHVAQQCLSSSVGIAGNIGVSPLSSASQKLHTLVLELSSFQLGDLKRVCEQQSVKKSPFGEKLIPEFSQAFLTNIYPDHQNRYNSFESYVADKMALFEFQNPNDQAYIAEQALPFIPPVAARLHTIGSNDQHHPEPRVQSIIQNSHSQTRIHSDSITIQDNAGSHIIPFSKIPMIPSIPNLYAVSFCIQSMLQNEVELNAILEALHSFKGLPHRMQYLGSFHGTTIFNDNAATIPQATQASLSQFNPTSNPHSAASPVVLILGGADKNLDLSPLETIAKNVSAIFLVPGNASERFKQYLMGIGYQNLHSSYKTFEEACIAALKAAHTMPSSVLLCSPGATSFAEFDHEFQRGDAFVTCVHRFFGINQQH